MNIDVTYAWLALLLLGAFHGINPGMGWLFAVALGLQEQKRAAVWRSLVPLALGHALAIGTTLLVVALVGRLVPLVYLKGIVAATLFGFGIYRLFRTRHPRYGGMRVGARDLTVWSFLMASAHGAGLMVLPFIFGTAMMQTAGTHEAAPPPVAVHHAHHVAPAAMDDQASKDDHASMDEHAGPAAGHAGHGGHAEHAAELLSSLPAEPFVGLLATLVHTLGYLLVMGVAAVVVYEKLGLRLLRTAWFNLDLIWTAALIATAVLTLLL